MPIQFACTGCGKQLRVDESSAGKRAKCPQCETILQVPNVAAASDPLAAATPPATAVAGGAANPYTPPSVESMSGPTPIAGGAVGNQRVTATQILNYAWEIWKSNLGLLVGVTVFTFAIQMVGSFVNQVLGAGMGAAGGPNAGIVIAFIVAQLVAIAVQMFFLIGQMQIVLKLARGQPARFNDLFGGGSRFWPTLGCVMLVYLMFISVGIVMVAVGALGANLGAGGPVIGITMFGFAVAMFVLMLMLWPFMYLVIDDKSKVFSSFSTAAHVTKENRWTTFVMVVMSIGIAMVGFIALFIGIIFAAPLVVTMWGVGYLMMSNQLTIGGDSSAVVA